MGDIPYKLRVKIGESEFEAEGSEDAVKEQYRLFLDALSATPQNSSENASQLVTPQGTQGTITGYAPDVREDLNPGVLEKAYAQSKELISLRMLPEGKMRDADALLMLLYGYLALKDEHFVPGTRLMKAARQSGLGIDRIDRAILPHKGLYNRGGARKGTRYGLNNQGQVKAKEILMEMFAS